MSTHAAAGAIDHHHDHTTTTGIPNKKLFMWAFLASDCMFFGALISTHLIYRLHPTPNQPDILGLFSLELTSFSTFILLMSSLLMALAVNTCQKGKVGATRKMLLGTIVFGLIFLACQVYEFSHFVHAKGLTLNSSMFGSTFYTLTGTHGCHVAIGVLWLVLMYIRTFKPADGSPWILKSVIHLLVFAVVTVASIKALLGGVHAIQDHGATAEAFSTLLHHELPALIATAVGLIALVVLARPSKAVEFGEANAVDVESMGLYWHFVDIVWIVIFTVVYLLEYL
ncbi:MAG: heme-copper oxidase subunit III [Opitutus sp.]|nr:heme-copper oxidase subunit III [Opitutus sp.]MCS6275070.1 heme-copper oxidase subunit III [Opitutus sp.]MCS6278266.1 heme-copper oxidase subunit III [Opitutus sp.]MCS6299376.1 heme-copper oxidase subunit III [Opitutus sp.]